MKKILKISIIIAGLIILVNAFNIAEKAQNYLHRKDIESQNNKTMELISSSDVIKKQKVELKTSVIDTDIDTESETEIEAEKDNESKILLPWQKIKRQESSTDQEEEIEKEVIVPPQAYLEVPFICQAPLQTEANWVYHEESCEEAAVLQAYLYETEHTLTKQEAHEAILDMIEWQNQNFGGHYDIYAEKIKEFTVGYYSIDEDKVEIIYDATIDDIKKQITIGHPVIVPITGEILRNPYYPYPGYHALVVIGFTEDRIITNDNGTRRGADFSYDNEVFKAAMDDSGADIVIIKLD